MKFKEEIFTDSGAFTVAGAPEGFDALVLAALAENIAGPVLHIARDAPRAAATAEALGYFAPDIETVRFPAWDCLPYDRVSPNAEICGQRMAALNRLVDPEEDNSKLIVIATVNAAVQRVPARAMVEADRFIARVGETVDIDALTAYLGRNGYARASTVVEPGDFAVRGGLVDIFPPGADLPRRLDFFGDVLESVRVFDSET